MFGIANARTLQRKLSRILFATVGLALVLAASALLLVEVAKEWRDAREDLASEAQMISLSSEAALTFADRKVAAQNLRVLQATPEVIAAAVYDNQGRLFAHFMVPGDDAAVVPPKAPGLGARFGLTTASIVLPVISNHEAIGRIYVQSRHGVGSQVATYAGSLLVIALGSLFAALLLARRLQSFITAPIREVSQVARTVLEQGSYEVRARKRSEDEVGQLVDAFNAMLEELGRRARVLQDTNRALSASEARYQLAARGSSAGLWDWDMEAGTMFYSPRLKSLLGYTNEEFPDTPAALPNLLHPEDRPILLRAVRNHLAQDAPFQVECRLRERQGGWRWFLVTGMALRGADGRGFRMAGSLIDVSERKQGELLLQESNRAKDEFLATLAHELRNPLAPLRTGLQILKRPNVAEPVQRRTLDTMDRQLTHMVRLIDDLLDISRINSGKIRLELAPTSLLAALQTALELSRPVIDAAGHALHVELPNADIVLQGDETRLAQAFGNLLNNAAKYTPVGGQIRLRAWQEGASAFVQVEDNGVGIAPEMLDRVFGLFAQVEGSAGRPGGLGIGLFLVRGLIEMHGGTVRAESAGADRGAIFTVQLPCLPATGSTGPRTESPARTATIGPRRVLVVDDNIDAAETLATLLEMLGLQARQVHDGREVVQAALEFRPEVVLLDIGLPGMDGYEVARALRAEPRLGRLTLIALTGWGAEEDRRRALAAGFDHHLTKPVDLAVLEDMLRRLQSA